MKNSKLFITALAGAFVGALTLLLFLPQKTGEEATPLYWVAPMDPNFRRDKPGKSPMGMDLIPVYEEAAPQADGEPGSIRISPAVINNLGVRTAPVENKSMQISIKTVGYVQYDQDKILHVHPRVEGWIEKLYVKAVGDPVEKNQPLYELYAPQLVNAQEELLLALSRNNAKLIEGTIEKLRALQISDKFIEEFKRNRIVQQTVPFYAAQSGVLDNLNIREGYYVIPGTTMMSIGILDEVWVEAEVFERQSGMLKVDLPVSMTLDYFPGKEWRGKVDYVYPSVNPQTRTARLRLRFKNADRLLKPNMFAEIVIDTGTFDALVVPQEALIRTGMQERVVLAMGEGRFKSVAVKVGRWFDEHVEILEGLKEGDTIVTSAQFLLDSESSIRSDFKRIDISESHEGMQHD